MFSKVQKFAVITGTTAMMVVGFNVLATTAAPIAIPSFIAWVCALIFVAWPIVFD